jgi:hypothetical protein
MPKLLSDKLLSTLTPPENTIDEHSFVATISLSYVLPFYVENEKNVLVISNGIVVSSEDYSIVSGTNIVFESGVISENDDIFIKAIPIVPGGTAISPRVHTFTATTDTSYTLPFTPTSAHSIIVAINGSVVSPENFNLVNKTISFDPAVISETDEVTIYNLVISLKGTLGEAVRANLTDFSFTATSDLTYQLPILPVDKRSLTIYLNGINVHPNDFSLAGDEITFNTGIVTESDIIYIKITDPVIAGYNITDAPSDNNYYMRRNNTWAVSYRNTYCTDSSSTANTILINDLSINPGDLVDGDTIHVKIANTNTSGTVVVDILGTTISVKRNGLAGISDPIVGSIIVDNIISLLYSGSNFIIIGGTPPIWE